MFPKPADYVFGDKRWEPGFSGSFFDDFTLSSATTVTKAAFYIVDTTPVSQMDDSINFGIRSSSANLPGAVIQTENSLTNTVSFVGIPGISGWNLLRYEIDISDLTLAAGTYWFEATINGTGGHFIAGGPNVVSGISAPLQNTQGNLYAGNRDYAWELISEQVNAVPEPTSFVIFGLGACVVGATRRRRS